MCWLGCHGLRVAISTPAITALSPTAGSASRLRERAGSLVTELADEVRTLVRDAGVDPQHEPDTVRRMGERVAQAHDRRSLTGAVAPVDDLEALIDELVARVSGFGPLQRYLDDPEVEEFWINDPTLASTQVRRSLLSRSPLRVRSTTERRRSQSTCGLAGSVLGRRPQVRVRVQRDRR